MLKVKEEYLEYSIGGGKIKSTKLKNLNPSQYELYYNKGFKYFFEIIEEEELNNDTIELDYIYEDEDFFNEEDEDITE